MELLYIALCNSSINLKILQNVLENKTRIHPWLKQYLTDTVQTEASIQMEVPVSLESPTLTVEDTGESAKLGFMLVTGRAMAAVWGTISSVPARTLDNDQV